MPKAFICILIVASGLLCPSYSDQAEEELLLAELQRLEVRSAHGEKSEHVPGVFISGVDAGNLKVLAKALSRYVGNPVRSSDASTIADEIVTHCEGNGLPLVTVFLPEQSFEDGRLIIELDVLKVGEVSKIGDSRLSDPQLLNLFGLHTGDQLTGGVLQAAIDRLNQNPFRTADVLAAEGTDDTEADLLIQIDETPPWRWFAGYDNAGSTFIGEDRLFSGFQWGDAFGLDYELGYQFTTSPTPNRFNAHSAILGVPLPWHHRLDVQTSVSEVEASVTGGGSSFDSSGSTWDIALRYKIPLPTLFRSWRAAETSRQLELRQSLSIGFEFRSTDNDVVFGGRSLFSSTVNTSQFVLGYNAELKDPWGENELALNYAWSPGSLVGNNSTANFAAIRSGATANYSIARARITRAQRLPAGFTLRLRAAAQLTDDKLLPSEQLAIGGYSTIRGLAQSEFLADRGYWVSTELRLPKMSGLLQRMHTDATDRDELQVYGFYDYSDVVQTPRRESHASVGVGLRWSLSQSLSFRVDHGWVLEGSREGNSRTYLGLRASF